MCAVAVGSFEQHDLIQYIGPGISASAYVEVTPPSDSGWLTYVQDEDTYYSMQGNAWVAFVADQAAMEAETATARFTSPFYQKFHPKHPKAWAYVSVSGGTPTLTSNSGVSSVSDSGVGLFGVSLTAQMSSVNYVIPSSFQGSASGLRACTIFMTSIGSGGYTISTNTATATADTALTGADLSTGSCVLGDV
jgi:hypothetical protein